MGLLLCGDLYVRPALDARGGLGDVRPVWRAFARHFRWVAGVPGNHDAFGTPSERTAFANLPGTLQEHLGWLGEAGFSTVEVYWKQMDLALMSGINGHLHMPWGHGDDPAKADSRGHGH